MAKYSVRKSFAYLDMDNQKVVVRKYKMDGNLYVVNKKGEKIINSVELSGDTLKFAKRIKAVEEIL